MPEEVKITKLHADKIEKLVPATLERLNIAESEEDEEDGESEQEE
jgi:hypothetical protein